MAANIFVGSVDNNWGTAGNWSLGTVPTANDGHVATFDASSPNCSINSTARVCNNIDFTNYTNTITFNVTLTVSGNVTLGSSMIFAGSEALIVNANSTFTSNTKTVDVPLRLGLVSSTITVTLTDDLTPHVSFNGTANSSVVNLNGFNLILKNNVSLSITVSTEFKGTTLFKVTGACTWSTGFFSLQRIENNFTVDSTGTLTLSGQVYYRTGTFSVVTGGTIVSTGSTFTCPFSSGANSVVFDLNGQSLNNVSFEGTTDAFIGITTDLLVNGNLSIGSANAIPYTFNGANIRISGNLTHNSNNNASVSGTTNFIMNGTGTISQPNTFNFLTSFRNNLEINTLGTITFSGTFYYAVGTLKYTAGAVITTGSTLVVPNTTTLNTNGIIWNNVSFNIGATYTITLTSDLYISGILTLGLNSSSNITINSNNIYLSGSLVKTGFSNTQGTTVINIIGTGTWTDTATAGGGITGQIRNNMVFNTTGIFSIVGTVYYNTGTLTYTSGTVNTAGSTLICGLSTTLNTNGITWNNVSFNNGVTYTITLASNLYISGTLNVGLNSSSNIFINSNNIYLSGSLIKTGLSIIQGTSVINITGTGSWTDTAAGGSLRNSIVFNTSGIFSIIGTVYYNTGTLTYIRGNIRTKSSTLHIALSTSLINMHKIIFYNIVAPSNNTLTMNEFFSGSPLVKTRISSNGANNYAISFTDDKKKISKYVRISNATGQLRVIGDSSCNRGNNVGVQFQPNQTPNGVALNNGITANLSDGITFGTTGLLNDPVYN